MEWRTRWTHDSVRSVTGWVKDLLGSVEKGANVFAWNAEEDLFQDRLGLADSLGPCKISRSAQNLKLTWQATGRLPI